jgi:alpha-galactosidase
MSRASRVHGCGVVDKAVRVAASVVLLLVLLLASKSIPATRTAAAPRQPIQVTRQDGWVSVRTAEAEFVILPSGYVEARLFTDGKPATLDEPGTDASARGYSIISGETEVPGFSLDLSRSKITDVSGSLGQGKKIAFTVPGTGPAGSKLEQSLAVEVYGDFPNVAVSTLSYKNVGTTALALNRVVTQRRRLNGALTAPVEPPYSLWSFQGSATQAGRDEVLQLTPGFSYQNQIGVPLQGVGGGIPVVAFWNKSVGLAIGHLETAPFVLSMPVKVNDDQRVTADLVFEPNQTLKPGESYSTPRTFVALYHGDFYDALRLYADLLHRQQFQPVRASAEAYDVMWCGWGYGFNVTPAQMIGTIPKLKELKITRATLDDRWFDTYGDWRPRPATFPDESIRKTVDEFHKNGIALNLWFRALAAEDGEGTYHEFTHQVSQVVRDHPDWLILDKDGKHAKNTRMLAVLCPALPEVQEYHRALVRRFLKDWDFDGLKMDNAFSAPRCYNPLHHHKSPDESVAAVGKVYQAVYETAHEVKPHSVVQVCPCGNPPNLAWLPYLDQSVTADPRGAAQVRRRIKMYKALLGSDAAVYGDHVEMTRARGAGEQPPEQLADFASTIGPGGVVGTNFTWPESDRANVFLSPAKDKLWQKWVPIYTSKMLSHGTFLSLYVHGYDIPEAYAIRKDGKTYYAFFSPAPWTRWTGEIELRGLGGGSYRVFDYVDSRDLGVVKGPIGRLRVDFTNALLLEVTPAQ